MRQLQCLLIFIFLFNISLSAKILCVFPVPYYSHQRVLRVLPQELAKQGHEVVIITPEPTGVIKENITEIDISEVSYEKFDKMYANQAKYLKTFAISPTEFLKIAYKYSYAVIETQINQCDIKKLMSNDHNHFDLILAEDCSRTAVIFAAKFHAPIILISSFLAWHESFEHVGSETNSLLFPYIQKTPESICERISVYMDAMKIKLMIGNMRRQDNYLIDKYFGKEALPVEEVRKNVKMVLLSAHRMWDNNRAVSPAVHYMGVIHLEKPTPLPEDLQVYFNRTKNVIFMSFGSKIKASDIPPHIITVILKVFASLPYDVLWKWNGKDLPNKPKNVRLEKWLPQADLLRHPSIKLFITQGGLQSTDEAIAAGVPLLGLPVLADQYQNIQKYKEYGIGTGMDIDSLNEQEFRRAILDVAENETYRENIRRLSRILSDQRVDGLQRAVHQVQFLLAHGFPLHSPAANISFAEYFMLDVFGPIVIALVIVSVATVSALKRLYYNNYVYYKKKAT